MGMSGPYGCGCGCWWMVFVGLELGDDDACDSTGSNEVSQDLAYSLPPLSLQEDYRLNFNTLANKIGACELIKSEDSRLVGTLLHRRP